MINDTSSALAAVERIVNSPHVFICDMASDTNLSQVIIQCIADSNTQILSKAKHAIHMDQPEILHNILVENPKTLSEGKREPFQPLL